MYFKELEIIMWILISIKLLKTENRTSPIMRQYRIFPMRKSENKIDESKLVI
jgi:hypothetical protein